MMADIVGSDYETVIMIGPLGSGKSLPAVHGLLEWLTNLPGNTPLNGIIASHTERQLQAAVIWPAADWAYEHGYEWNARRGPKYELQTDARTITFWPLMGKNRGDEEKAKSYNASFALIDEATDLIEPFVQAVMARVRVAGPKKIIIAANPSGPQHWLKRNYVDDCDETMVHHQSQLSDNPSLSKSYITRLKKAYTGAQYRRLVLGEWAASTGLVWPEFGSNIIPPIDPNTIWRYLLGVDDAESGVLHAVLIGQTVDDRMIAVDELRYDGAARGQISPHERARRICLWLDKRQPALTSIDPMATAMMVELRRYGQSARPADNDVMQGCQYVNWLLNEKTLFISADCEHLIREGSTYEWDDRLAELGEDRPKKIDDHGCDALRYGLWSAASTRKPRIVRHK